jgi:heat shock protein beta
MISERLGFHGCRLRSLGFYSVFLVSSDVQVSSLPPPTLEAPNPRQHTFVSSATGDEFKIFPDPRGQTLLPCGTEIVLEIDEEGAKEGWLDEDKLKAIM